MARLTKAQRALVELIRAGLDRRYMTRPDAERKGVLCCFEKARKGGLIVSAGYECSGIGDQFLDSPAGRAALAEAEGKGGKS